MTANALRCPERPECPERKTQVEVERDIACHNARKVCPKRCERMLTS
jgi:hypothetical protein